MFGHHFFAPQMAHHQRQQQQRHCQQEPNFQGLFRLIDDWDRYAQQADSSSGGAAQSRRAAPRSFTPKFDVRETETTYELLGELPGVDKENVHIEFTDPQTIQIRGRVERSHNPASPSTAAALIGGAADEDDEAVMVDAEENQPGDHNDEQHETGSNRSFQATVEDDVDADDNASTTTSQTNAAGAAVHTPATTTATVAEAAKPQPPQQKQQQPQKPQPKFLLSERSVGEFARTFTFPARVEAEGVRAALDRGVLSVSVPKARKHESWRIAIL